MADLGCATTPVAGQGSIVVVPGTGGIATAIHGPFFRYFGRMHNCFWPRAFVSRLGAQPCVAKSCKNVPKNVRDIHFTPRLWCAMGVGDLGGTVVG